MNYLRKKIIHWTKRSDSLLNLAAFIYSIPFYFCHLHKLITQTIRTKGAFIRNTKIRTFGSNNIIHIHPETRLTNCSITIIGNNCNLVIDKHCIITNLEFWIQDNNGSIIVGHRTTTEGGHIAATEGKTIRIGADCMFSHRIEIRNGDSHSIFSSISSQRINHAKDVTIGDHVWLGADVKVLKGARIGDGSIIATGAIVTKDVESHVIAAGTPAKVVKRDISWLRER